MGASVRLSVFNVVFMVVIGVSTVCWLGCGGGSGAPSSRKDITRFVVLGQEGTISSDTVRAVVPAGTDRTHLAPSITHQGTDISPASGVYQNFSAAVTYTVTAEDHSTKAYAVTILGAECGNGVQEPGEECDDGNLVNGDGCSSACKLPVCGDGTVDPGEECDDGNLVNGDGCSSACVLATCGDGTVDPGEECDDGNLVSGDGCSSTCMLPVCGDGTVDPGEECDDGNVVNGDGCSSACMLPICGDGTVDPGEDCDDGNQVGGDGCSSTCKVEP